LKAARRGLTLAFKKVRSALKPRRSAQERVRAKISLKSSPNLPGFMPPKAYMRLTEPQLGGRMNP
ncbi:hypothetical protein, partial [Rothia mucilaginosa]|uniref:hypothetical protein n=1 Tax=Rothia mucilaginosa TaxID=43675 RepID=UPI003C79F75F